MTRIAMVATTGDVRTLVGLAYESGAPVTVDEFPAAGFDPALVDEIIATEPDAVTVGPDLGDDDALKMAEELIDRMPQLSVVLVATPNAELWPRALRAGVRDVLSPVASDTTIRETLDRALEHGRRLQSVAPVAVAAELQGRIIAVVSAKGGSGKTTFAANLAATVARTRPDEVVLADLDVQFGDVQHAFRLDPEYSLLNAVAGGVTPTMLKGFLTPHPSNVLSLAAPDRPEDADDISPEAAAQVVRDLSSMFPVVVVDTAAGLDETTLAAVEAATDVVFVSATDVPSVRAVVKEHDILGRLGMLEDTTTHLVLNRADARVGLSVGDIEETIGLTAQLRIPSTRAVPAALNLGEPVVLDDERSGIARSFTTFAEDAGLVEPVGSETAWPWRKSR